MIVLGFDTSTPSTVVGLRVAAGNVLEARDDPDGERRPGHATRLLVLAHDLLAQAGLGWGAIERIAVGVGPGTFTGLRIGVATARGLAQSLGVEPVGVSSLRALAYLPPVAVSVSQSIDGEAERSQRILAAIDARRGEVFVAGYEHGRESIAPQAVPPEALAELLASTAPDTQAEQWLALGDGALLYREAFEQAGVHVAEDVCDAHRIHAAAICELGACAPVGAKSVVPDYRRRPDAEAALQEAVS